MGVWDETRETTGGMEDGGRKTREERRETRDARDDHLVADLSTATPDSQTRARDMKQRIVAMAAVAATPAPGLGVVAGVRAEVIDDDN